MIVKHGPAGPDVGPGVHRLPGQLLRRHIRQRANHQTGLVQADSLCIGSFRMQYFRQAEVENLEVTIRGDPKIPGLQIAVYQMLPVSSCQSLGKLNTEAKSFRLGKGTRSQHFIQANA